MALKNAEAIRQKILEELSKYPKEKVEDLIEQIENASEEELEDFILSQQKQSQHLAGKEECIFCSIILGKIETIKIYEDNEIMAILDIMPASLGHILVFPKQHKHFIQEIDDKILSKIFIFIKQISPVIVKILKAEGISIYIPQGQIAGQRIPHFAVNVIPRYNNDKIAFEWNREKKDKKELEKIADKIKKEISNIKPETPTEKKEDKKHVIKLKRKIPR